MLLGRYLLNSVDDRPQLVRHTDWRSHWSVARSAHQSWAIALVLVLLMLGAGARESSAQLVPLVAKPDQNAQNRTTPNQNVPLSQQLSQSQSLSVNQTAASYQTLYVNAETGSNQASGIEAQPLKTVTRALEIALPNTVIVLAPGRYTQASGEVFPIQLKPGVTIQGAPGSGDRAAIIEGGGQFVSPTQSRQNTAIIAADRAGIAQVVISNPDGYGVWIESANPTILESAFVNNRQTGLYIASSSPRVQGSYFSGNRVAGLIVLGRSTALIYQNTFDNTGDAIRVLEGATPEIVANRLINNEAGLVVIGSGRPTLRDNQLSGNRRDEVVEAMASSGQGLLDNAEPTATALPVVPPAIQPAIVPPVEPVREPAVTALPVIEPAIELVALEPATEQAVEPALELAVEPTAIASEPDQVLEEILPGAPGAALAALSAGIGSEAKAERNSDLPGSLLLNARRRRREEQSPVQESLPTAAPLSLPTVVSPPVNNNRLAVPSSSIPVGSGSSSIIFSPPNGGAGAPPAPPSRAQALGLYYRVFVEASDPFVQDAIRSVVPDAFRTRFEGRAVMQVGAFPTEAEAEDRRRLLEENNYDALVEYIR